MLYGKKLFEYHSAKRNLLDVEKKLKQLNDNKNKIEYEQQEQRKKIESIQAKEKTEDTMIELALAEQQLLLLQKDNERFEKNYMEQSFELLQKKLDLEHQINDIKMNLPDRIWKEYNKRLEILDNPVVEVKLQMCTGCFIPLSKSNLDHWRKGKEIVVCDVCNRILA